LTAALALALADVRGMNVAIRPAASDVIAPKAHTWWKWDKGLVQARCPAGQKYEDRDTEGAADLAAGLVDGAADGEALGIGT
jgi:hypothetical protein